MRSLLATALIAVCAANAGAWGFGGWGSASGSSTADPGQDAAIASNDVDIATLSASTETNASNIASNDLELAQVGIDTATNSGNISTLDGRLDVIEYGLANPVFASSQASSIPITVASPGWQSISTTTAILNGGRPYFIIFSFAIDNETGVEKEYNARFLSNGSETGVIFATTIQGLSSDIHSFHWADASSSPGTQNFTLQINTSSAIGTQTITSSRVTIVEM